MLERARWEQRHATASGPPTTPSPFVLRWARRVRGEPGPSPTALDLACGGGRHLAALVQAGWQPVGLDFSRAAARQATAFCPAAQLVVADATALPFRAQSFGLVVVSRFLDRPGLAGLGNVLGPGGVLVVETFLEDQHHATGHPALRFCLARGELARLLAAAGLVLEELEEGPCASGPETVLLARSAARRPLA